MKIYDAAAAILLLSALGLSLINEESKSHRAQKEKERQKIETPKGITYYIPSDTTNVDQIVNKLNPGDSVVITTPKPALDVDNIDSGQAAPKNPSVVTGSNYKPVIDPVPTPSESPSLTETQRKIKEAVEKILKGIERERGNVGTESKTAESSEKKTKEAAPAATTN